jgi:tRNA(fMet)-specific endonuclease VapC
MLVLVDTNVLIDFQRGSDEAGDFFDDFIDEENPLFSSVICAMELLRGARTKAEMQELTDLLKAFYILDVDAEVSREAYRLFSSYYLSHSLDISDSFIAATAVVNDMVLMTRNDKHFKMVEGLEVKRPY